MKRTTNLHGRVLGVRRTVVRQQTDHIFIESINSSLMELTVVCDLHGKRQIKDWVRIGIETVARASRRGMEVNELQYVLSWESIHSAVRQPPEPPSKDLPKSCVVQGTTSVTRTSLNPARVPNLCCQVADSQCLVPSVNTALCVWPHW